MTLSFGHWLSLSVAAGAVLIACITTILLYTIDHPYNNKPNSPWTETFSTKMKYDPSDPRFQIGKGVSIDNEGNLQVGGGFTLYKNIFYEEDTQAKHLQVLALSNNVIVSTYDAYLRVFILNDDDTVRVDEKISLPDGANPDQMHLLGDGVIVIIGKNTIYPFKVEISEKDEINVIWGTDAKFSATTSVQPEYDSLDDDCIAMSYFSAAGSNIDIFTCVACMHDIDNENFGVTIMASADYSPDYTFHGIAGLSKNKYILAHAGTWPPAPSSIDKLYFVLATYEDHNLTFSEPIAYEFHGSKGFFDFDNFNDEIAVCTFVEEAEYGAIASLIVKYNKDTDSLEFGPYKQLQTGGGSGTTPTGLYEFIYLRILSETRFGVIYSNVLVDGSTCLAMAEITPTLDIVPVGPEYIISKPLTDEVRDYYWVDITIMDNVRFVINEAMTSAKVPHYAIHIGEVKSIPVGVITSLENGIATIAVAGSVKLPDSFPPLKVGKYYYIDSKGSIVEGEYAGTSDMNGVIKYIKNDKEIISLHNRLGLAVDEHTIYIQKNDLDL